MTPNRILDEALGGESPIRYGLRDASEVQLGRITQATAWDRRYRPKYAPPEPVEPQGWRFFLEVAKGTALFGGMFLALWGWVSIAGAVQP